MYYIPERESQFQGQGEVQQLLRGREVNMLLIALPAVTGYNKALKNFTNRCHDFCRQARQSGIPIVLLTWAMGGSTWTKDTTQRLSQQHDLYMSRHSWCRLGVSVGQLPPGQVSNQKGHTATSFAFRNRQCTCLQSTSHVDDWSSKKQKDELTLAERAKAHDKYYHNILEQLRQAAPPVVLMSSVVGSSLVGETVLSRPHPLQSDFLPAPESEGHTFPAKDSDGTDNNPTTKTQHEQGQHASWGSRGSPAAPSSVERQTCLPTAARERQKAKEKAAKAQGQPQTKQKKKQHVEAHYDDCGDSLDGLNLLAFAAADNETYVFMIDSEGSDNENYDLEEYCEPWCNAVGAVYMFMGDTTMPQGLPSHVYIAANMQEAYTWSQSSPPDQYVDVVELCGGAGRPLEIAIRRRMRAGRNFDLTTGVDLSQPAEVAAYWRYLRKSRPRVIVMAPPCTPFGPWAHFNKIMSPQGYQRSLKECLPLARLAGETALHQLDQD